jgi:hypothetical protein
MKSKYQSAQSEIETTNTCTLYQLKELREKAKYMHFDNLAFMMPKRRRMQRKSL